MLTGKQKRYLRSLANTLLPIAQIGKNGIELNGLVSINQALQARELVKISVLKNCEMEMEAIILDTLAYTKAELVQKIGRTFIIYKKSKEPKIILP